MAPQMMMRNEAIVVTATRLDKAMIAREENLGDVKLYRVPEHVTVAAKGLKQVAFLDKGAVTGRLMYQTSCHWEESDSSGPAEMRFETVNDAKHGLGVALPTGGVTFFEPSSRGDLFVGEQQLRDFAAGQDVEISLGDSAQVQAACTRAGGNVVSGWGSLKATVTNANPHPITLRVKLGAPQAWRTSGLSATRLKDGETVTEVTVPANGKRELTWQVRSAGAED
jgi:hypothetical protein